MIVGLAIRTDLVVIGALGGLGYAVLATGLVLLYRAKRLLNLAHGQLGAFTVALFIVVSGRTDIPYAPAALISVGVGALLGLVIDVGITRRIANSSRLALLVATIGVSQLLLVAQLKLPRVEGTVFPTPFDWTWEAGTVTLRSEHLMLLVFGPLTLASLALVLRGTRMGLHIRAVADNSDAARLAGVPAGRVSAVVWMFAGVLSAIAAMLTVPLSAAGAALATGGSLGPSLLLRALAAALAGRMESMPRTAIAAVCIGVVEAIMRASYPADPGFTDFILFVAILGMLLVQGRSASEAEDEGIVALDNPTLHRDLRTHPRVVRARRTAVAIGALVLISLPTVYPNAEDLFRLSRIPIFALIGLSVVVLTGWSGQLSLGQIAFVGMGSVGTSALQSRGVPYGAAVAYATIAAIVVAVAVGLPSSRIRGLYLAVSTLAFGIAMSSYVLRLDFLFGGQTDSLTVAPGSVGPINFNDYQTFYYLCVLVTVLVAISISRLRRTDVGRRLIGVESNDRALAALGASPSTARLSAFAVSGGIAALAGGLLGGAQRTFQVDIFSPDVSLQVVAMTVIGGLGSVAGAVIGAVYLIGVPILFGDSQVSALATSGIGLLAVLMIEPRGLVGLVSRWRDVVAHRLTGGAIPQLVSDNVDSQPDRQSEINVPSWHQQNGHRPPTAAHDRGAQPCLDVEGLTVDLGGRSIVSAVDLVVYPGEIVGLIGTNGAGKTTILNAVTGYVPSTGTVRLEGVEIGELSPQERADAGIGRSFQDARLFPRLTTRECVELARSRHHNIELVPTLLGLAPSARAELALTLEADDILASLGLTRFQDSTIASLSTGTRRIVELAQLIALEPRVILLDEPMAGVAQREREAFVPLIADLRTGLDAPMLVIEHDIPLMLKICDRIYCLEAGTVIASGTPDEIRNDPSVIASYLGAKNHRPAPRRRQVASSARREGTT